MASELPSQRSCLAALSLNLRKVRAGGEVTLGLSLRQHCVEEPWANRTGRRYCAFRLTIKSVV